MNPCTKLFYFTEGSRAKIGDFCHSSQKGPSLQYTATHCNTLQHTASHCNTCNTCNTLQHAATRGNTLQHAAPRCNTLQHTPQVWVFLSMLPRGSIKKSLSTRPMYTQKSLIYSTEPYIHYRKAPYTLERAFRTLKHTSRTLNHTSCTLKHVLTPNLGGGGFFRSN